MPDPVELDPGKDTGSLNLESGREWECWKVGPGGGFEIEGPLKRLWSMWARVAVREWLSLPIGAILAGCGWRIEARPGRVGLIEPNTGDLLRL